MAKRMVNEAEEVNKLTEYVRQEGKKTIIGGNLEVDGDLTVNGKAPGGESLHVYKVSGTGNDGATIYFLWTCNRDDMTASSMTAELNYKLSSGSGFGMGIPAMREQITYYNCLVVYDGGLKVYYDGSGADLTINTVYKIY